MNPILIGALAWAIAPVENAKTKNRTTDMTTPLFFLFIEASLIDVALERVNAVAVNPDGLDYP
jgi:hypothetical protein